MSSIFLIGTDTSVGKTIIACAIAAHLRSLGVNVGVMKPAESGCKLVGGELIPADAVRLKNISGSKADVGDICPYRFAEALAPGVAASRAGVTIDISHIKRKYDELAGAHDMMIVEGAGGLMVPLSGRYLYLDLAIELGLPVVIVGRLGLGAINHMLLTINALRARNIEIYGIVLNQSRPGEPGIAEVTNPDVIRELTGIRRMVVVPYAGRVGRNRAILAEIGGEMQRKGFFT